MVVTTLPWDTLHSETDDELRYTERFAVPKNYWARAFVVEVIDGDTVDLSVTLPCVRHPLTFRARMLRINAPETHTKDAEEKRAGRASAEFLTHMVKDRVVVARIDGADMYGRLLVDLYTTRNTRLAKTTETKAPSVSSVIWNAVCRGCVVLMHCLFGAPPTLDTEDLVDVNEAMIQNGHAVPYDGKGARAPFRSAAAAESATSAPWLAAASTPAASAAAAQTPLRAPKSSRT